MRLLQWLLEFKEEGGVGVDQGVEVEGGVELRSFLTGLMSGAQEAFLQFVSIVQKVATGHLVQHHHRVTSTKLNI